MKEQIKWNATNGKEITVTAELILTETIFADGANIEVKCCKLNVGAEVEDIGSVATSAPMKRPNIQSPLGDAVAIMGRLALNQEKYDLVMAAIAKIEATPEWQAKMEAQKEADKIDQEYEAHRAKMNKIMGY